jgi:hypothetical protein
LQHDTALQVTAMRVTVEQIQESRIGLLQEEHTKELQQLTNQLQQLSKQGKDQLSVQQLKETLVNGDGGEGGSSLAASEHLTRQYQALVQVQCGALWYLS